MTREELLNSSAYWTTKIQLDLYSHVRKYMSDNGINNTELAKMLGVSKGYVSQLLNGDYNHRLSKLVELALKIGLRPNIFYTPVNDEQNVTLPECCSDENIMIHKSSRYEVSLNSFKAISYNDTANGNNDLAA